MVLMKRTCQTSNDVLQRVGLEIINIMNNDASLNASAGAYQGLDRFEARKRLWADMEVSPKHLLAPASSQVVRINASAKSDM